MNESILQEIAIERERQQSLWGTQNHSLGFDAMYQLEAKEAKWRTEFNAEKGALTWYDILNEEVQEARAEADFDKARKELIQVAAVVVAMIDWIGSPL